MAYSPIAFSLPQFDRTLYAGYWLKGYAQGTVTPLAMATDSTGATTLARAEIDQQGFINTVGDARFIPHFNAAYDLWLFPTYVEADANLTANAIQVADNINPQVITSGVAYSGEFESTNTTDSTSTTTGAIRTLGGLGVAKQIFAGGTVHYSKGADIASSTSLVLGTDGNYFDVTGTTAITSIVTVGVGTIVRLQFDGELTLTHHATDLILPGNANITTAAGDVAEFHEYDTGDWKCVNYQRAGIAPGIDKSIVVRTASTGISSSTTLANDSQLTMSLAANSTFEFEFLLKWASSSSTPDAKFRFVPTDATYSFTGVNFDGPNAAVAFGLDESTTEVVVPVVSGRDAVSNGRGIVQTGVSGGTFVLAWAQNTSNASVTSIETGSFIRATKIA